VAGTGNELRYDVPRENGRLALWAIIVLGAVVRLIALGYKGFWLDEIASVAIARRTAPVFWHFLWHDEGNMAAYYVLLRPWLHFGYGEAMVRLLSVIPGVLSIPLLYALARKLFSRDVGLLAALLLALNACAIRVSQEARAYSFVVFAALLSTYLFAQLLEGPSFRLACGYALVAGLSCYFHYFGVLIPVAHYVAVIGVPSRRRPWRQLLMAAVIIVILAAPILWLMHAQDTGHISWVQPPSWLELYHLGAFLAADSGKAVGAVLLVLDLALMGVFLAGLRKVWREDAERRWRYLLVLSLVATPIVITLLASIVRPAFYHRFLIICLPGWILMIALGAEQIRSQTRRKAAIAGVCLLSVVSTVIIYRRVTEDWRGAVRYLVANTRPGDRVLYYESVGEFAGESYRDWLAPDSPRPGAIGVKAGSKDWEQEIGDAQHVWLVRYRVKPNDKRVEEIREKLDERKFSLDAVSSYKGVTVMEFTAQ
jgi:uncharacterized membrane protein